MDQLDMVLKLAAQNNAWSAEQAQKQMDFQERMSNTAHQREIADLKASGLNPVLSSKLAGASTPSGASATADSSIIGAVVEILKEFSEGMMSSAASGYSRGIASVLDGPAVFDVEGTPVSAHSLQVYNTNPSKQFAKTMNQAVYAVSPPAAKILKLAPNPWTAAIGGIFDKFATNKSMKDAAKTGNYVYTSSGRVAIKNLDGTYTVATPRQEKRYFKK